VDCPKCNSPMEKVKYGSIEVDRCTTCKGIWFDLREHEHLKALSGSESIDTGSPEEGATHSKIGDIDCPVCHARMIRMVDVKQPHIWYESCPVCYGVFFDAGEFKDYKEETVQDFFKDLLAQERR
jgi:Zn-finger nucleic acid-binding protein